MLTPACSPAALHWLCQGVQPYLPRPVAQAHLWSGAHPPPGHTQKPCPRGFEVPSSALLLSPCVVPEQPAFCPTPARAVLAPRVPSLGWVACVDAAGLWPACLGLAGLDTCRDMSLQPQGLGEGTRQGGRPFGLAQPREGALALIWGAADSSSRKTPGLAPTLGLGGGLCGCLTAIRPGSDSASGHSSV